MHKLNFKEIVGNDVIFECELCGNIIGFNKEGVGEPSAKEVDGVWVHPENPEQWMGECPQAA
jgi:hypothetical protein